MIEDLTIEQGLLLNDFFYQGQMQLKNLAVETSESPKSTDDPELDEFFNQASVQVVYIKLPEGMTRHVYADKIGEALTSLFKGLPEPSEDEQKEIVDKIVFEIKYYG